MRIPAHLTALILLALAAGCQSAGRSSSRQTATASDAGQAIPKILDEYNTALLKNDRAALDRIWADDLTFVNPRGELLTKAQRLANLQTGATAFRAANFDEVAIRQYGDNAAISTLRVKLDAQYGGQESGGTYRVTMGWSRKVGGGGPWQMVAVHMTRVAP
jgi:ketosteroid isomerase-like protein